jgi:hypothetical protein
MTTGQKLKNQVLENNNKYKQQQTQQFYEICSFSRLASWKLER